MNGLKAAPAPQKGRRYHSARNLVWGIGSQIVISLFNFIIRTIIVRSLGLAFVSLNGLFTEIISMLTLSELGIGTAITYSLYKPIAEGDEDKMCQLMTLYKKAYRIIALVIFGAGLILVPFVPNMVDDIGFPAGYIRVVFLLFVAKTGCSYFYSYKSGIIAANQRMYIVTTIQSVFSILSSLVALCVLLLTKEFVAYLCVQIAFTLMSNMYLSHRADKEYGFLKRSMPLPKDEEKKIFLNIRSIFIGRLSGKITNSTDNILINMLVGTLFVGRYSNYSMILGVLTAFLIQFQSAISASFGNMFATESKERCERTLSYLTFAMALVGCVCASALYGAMTPLVTLWLGEEYTIAQNVVFVLSLNFFFSVTRVPLWIAMNVSGLFKYDKFTSIAGSVVNLISSVILGLRYGMLGIFIGTSLTHIIQIISKSILLYRKYFVVSSLQCMLRWLGYTLICLIGMLATHFVCMALSPMNAILRLCLCALLPAMIGGALMLLAYSRSAELKRLFGAIRRLLRGGFKRAHT